LRILAGVEITRGTDIDLLQRRKSCKMSVNTA
jgi:hypothetical protein